MMIRMKRGGFWILVISFPLFATYWNLLNVKGTEVGRTLQVKLEYTGVGHVEEKHKIHVLLFDSDPSTQETFKPLDSKAVTIRNGIVTFSHLNFSPAYVMAFYDKYGSDQPESGCPAGMYGKEPGRFDPIEIEQGKTAQVIVAFDDSITIP
jgi:hypothetical protein